MPPKPLTTSASFDSTRLSLSLRLPSSGASFPSIGSVLDSTDRNDAFTLPITTPSTYTSRISASGIFSRNSDSCRTDRAMASDYDPETTIEARTKEMESYFEAVDKAEMARQQKEEEAEKIIASTYSWTSYYIRDCPEVNRGPFDVSDSPTDNLSSNPTTSVSDSAASATSTPMLDSLAAMSAHWADIDDCAQPDETSTAPNITDFQERWKNKTSRDYHHLGESVFTLGSPLMSGDQPRISIEPFYQDNRPHVNTKMYTVGEWGEVSWQHHCRPIEVSEVEMTNLNQELKSLGAPSKHSRY